MWWCWLFGHKLESWSGVLPGYCLRCAKHVASPRDLAKEDHDG